MSWRDQDLSGIATEELTRIVGILMCDRMLVTTGPDGDTETDAKIAALEAELAKRRTSLIRSERGF